MNDKVPGGDEKQATQDAINQLEDMIGMLESALRNVDPSRPNPRDPAAAQTKINDLRAEVDALKKKLAKL